MSTDALYQGREQSLVKHYILQKYLCDFAHKVGFGWDAITYVDCFSGPWNVRSSDLADSSFSIALNQLRQARQTLQGHGRTLRIRCFFLEKNRAAYAQLEEFGRSISDAEVRTKNMALAEATGEILSFIREGGERSFPFIFIDPTGWSGLDMQAIRPLLQLQPGEVLINFMTDFIRRFVESPKNETAESFNRFFGRAGLREQMISIEEPQDREDALFLSYARQVQQVGGFNHSCAAIVLHPEYERSFFHLIYATRNPAGVDVFKRVEQSAMDVMELARSSLHLGRVEIATGGPSLFTPQELPHARRLHSLRTRYLEQARTQAEICLRTQTPVLFDDLWAAAVSLPLVWGSDVKEWISDWRGRGALEIRGMQPRQRVPRLNESNMLIWKEPPPRQKLLFE